MCDFSYVPRTLIRIVGLHNEYILNLRKSLEHNLVGTYLINPSTVLQNQTFNRQSAVTKLRISYFLPTCTNS